VWLLLRGVLRACVRIAGVLLLRAAGPAGRLLLPAAAGRPAWLGGPSRRTAAGMNKYSDIKAGVGGSKRVRTCKDSNAEEAGCGEHSMGLGLSTCSNSTGRYCPLSTVNTHMTGSYLQCCGSLLLPQALCEAACRCPPCQRLQRDNSSTHGLEMCARLCCSPVCLHTRRCCCQCCCVEPGQCGGLVALEEDLGVTCRRGKE
jgi:hypothetical protein